MLRQASRVFAARSQVQIGFVGLIFQPIVLFLIVGFLGLVVLASVHAVYHAVEPTVVTCMLAFLLILGVPALGVLLYVAEHSRRTALTPQGRQFARRCVLACGIALGLMSVLLIAYVATFRHHGRSG